MNRISNSWRTRLLTSLLLVLALPTLAEGPLTVRKVDLSGLKVSLSLPSEFQPFPTGDTKRTAIFQDPKSGNVMVMNPGESITEQDLMDPKLVGRIVASGEKDGVKLISHQMVTLPGKRKALKILLEIPGKTTKTRQLRYMIAGDPGPVIMFTTTHEQAPKFMPKTESWIQTLRF
jgi:hypothetical protein